MKSFICKNGVILPLNTRLIVLSLLAVILLIKTKASQVNDSRFIYPKEGSLNTPLLYSPNLSSMLSRNPLREPNFQKSRSYVYSAPQTTTTTTEDVICGNGKYISADKVCKLCPKGTYNDEDLINQERCKACVTGKTTLGEGSKSDDDCDIPISITDHSPIPINGESHVVAGSDDAIISNTTVLSPSTVAPTPSTIPPASKNYYKDFSVPMISTSYLGHGYNVKYGIPQGSAILSYDPGFTQPLLSDEIKMKRSKDGSESRVPIFSQPVSSCVHSKVMESMSTVKDYQNKIGTELEITGVVSTPFVEIGLKSTKGYQDFKHEVLDNEKTRLCITSMCVTQKSGLILSEFDFELARNSTDNSFVIGRDMTLIPNEVAKGMIQTLPSYTGVLVDDALFNRKWFSMFELMGTHVVVQVTMGGKMIEETISSKTENELDITTGNESSKGMEVGVKFPLSMGASAQVERNKSAENILSSDLDQETSKMTVRFLGGIPPEVEGGSSSDVFAAWSHTVKENSMPVHYRLAPLDILEGVNSNDYYIASGRYLEISDDDRKKLLGEIVSSRELYGNLEAHPNAYAPSYTSSSSSTWAASTGTFMVDESLVIGQIFIPSLKPIVVSPNGESKSYFTNTGSLNVVHDRSLARGVVQRATLFDSFEEQSHIGDDEIVTSKAEKAYYTTGCWPEATAIPGAIDGRGFNSYGKELDSTIAAGECTNWVLIFGKDGDLCTLEWNAADSKFEYRWCTNTFDKVPHCGSETKCPIAVKEYAEKGRVGTCAIANMATLRDNGELVLHTNDSDYEHDHTQWMWRTATAMYNGLTGKSKKIVRGILYGQGQNNCAGNKDWKNESKGTAVDRAKADKGTFKKLRRNIGERIGKTNLFNLKNIEDAAEMKMGRVAEPRPPVYDETFRV